MVFIHILKSATSGKFYFKNMNQHNSKLVISKNKYYVSIELSHNSLTKL